MAGLTLYNSYQLFQTDGTAVIDWDLDSVKAALVTSAYTPNSVTHDYWDDVNANEVVGTNYTADGTAIATLDSTVSSGGVVTIDGGNVTWSQAAGSPEGFNDARYLIVYKDTGTPATSVLVGFLDLVTNRTNITGDFIIQWDALGIIRYGVGTITGSPVV